MVNVGKYIPYIDAMGKELYGSLSIFKFSRQTSFERRRPREPQALPTSKEVQFVVMLEVYPHLDVPGS